MSDYTLPSIPAEDALTGAVHLLDVRKAPARKASARAIADAVWIDPYTLGFDHPIHAHPGPVAYFCVHGHEVSNFAAALARVAGQDAVFVRGGFDALIAAGARTEDIA